ncbi:MAG: hypothetical protein U1E34_14095 [Amaricoccus sp.]
MPSALDRQTRFLALINISLLVAGAILVGQAFVDSCNLQSMASQVPELGLLALGVMLAMVSGNGGIDLFVGIPSTLQLAIVGAFVLFAGTIFALRNRAG